MNFYYSTALDSRSKQKIFKYEDGKCIPISSISTLSYDRRFYVHGSNLYFCKEPYKLIRQNISNATDIEVLRGEQVHSLFVVENNLYYFTEDFNKGVRRIDLKQPKRSDPKYGEFHYENIDLITDRYNVCRDKSGVIVVCNKDGLYIGNIDRVRDEHGDKLTIENINYKGDISHLKSLIVPYGSHPVFDIADGKAYVACTEWFTGEGDLFSSKRTVVKQVDKYSCETLIGGANELGIKMKMGEITIKKVQCTCWAIGLLFVDKIEFYNYNGMLIHSHNFGQVKNLYKVDEKSFVIVTDNGSYLACWHSKPTKASMFDSLTKICNEEILFVQPII